MKTPNIPIPVAVFVYNRPDLLQLLLETLKADEVPLLYIFSDAPKIPAHQKEVVKVRTIIQRIDWCKTIIHEQKENLGLGESIKFGVSLVLSKHDAIIVFEDDLVCVKGTYNYLSTALRHYQHEDRVMSVTGWTHPKITPQEVENTPYFDGKSECWCWGTWANAWEGMNQSVIEIYNQCILNGIDVEKYGTDLPKMALEANQKNLWAVGWWYLHLLKDGLCLRPPYSLVETTGWDGRGVTITPEMQDWKNPPLRCCPSIPKKYPAPIENNVCASLWKKAIDGSNIKTTNSYHFKKMDSSFVSNGIWMINDLLSPTESNYLILLASKNQFQKARNGEKYGRYNQETFLSNPEFLNLIRVRLMEKINNSAIGFLRFEHTTNVLEFYHYQKGDYVAQHQDAPIPISKTIQSNYTLIIYLNDQFKGGQTYFGFSQKGVTAKSGSAVLFNQSLNHEGKTVEEGDKYILRLNLFIDEKN